MKFIDFNIYNFYRVLSVLKFWMTRHFEDFENDPPFIVEFKRFVESQMISTMKVPAQQLLKSLEKRVKQKKLLIF